MNKLSKRKKIVLFSMLGLVLCLAVANQALNNQQSLVTSTEYTNYEEKEMQKHDGDVLVDSLNIKEIPATNSAVQSEASDSKVVTSDDISDFNANTYFEEVRATIDLDRNQVISMLTDVLEETDSTVEKENATKQKLKIIGYMEKEKVIENLISTKGLPETLVLITDNAVNVTVNKQQLEQTDVAKICDIVIRETGRPASQIVIQSKV
ncbi:SpoIIIAH-like family protein [Clostridium aminobutyricum]|uniref:SpoIIIAH-like family protein n=1 Tax=Clostridium aminobutyricum TaxID=33953 RepID=A0A939IGU3_CLOAM|nr:SpoIIIAH-like family protein [Clostridium aminobutyricum]MBN7772527.1 SpoIIIAH-like family protein [Clostridium aminobutyricum]